MVFKDMKAANLISAIRSCSHWLFTNTDNLCPGPHTLQLGRPECRRCVTTSDRLDFLNELGLKSLEEHRNQMLANGWCHHQVQHLSTLTGPLAFSYLASRQCSTRLLDHTTCMKHLTCVAYNTDPAAYETRHIEPRCHCFDVATPTDELIKIIRGGGVPLISIEESLHDLTAPTIRVSARNRMSKYIAVSHVWADGLGNPSGNALPLCQIKKLKLAVTALHRTFKYSRDEPLVRLLPLLLSYQPSDIS